LASALLFAPIAGAMRHRGGEMTTSRDTCAVASPGCSLVHGPDSPLAAVVHSCRRVASSDATVLVSGETGTGKEVVARFLHAQSARADRPFVAVKCGAIPEALLEPELFGQVPGAPDGDHGRQGRIAAAEGGTLFLDDVGELPRSFQAKLLRVLQERAYEPAGSTGPVHADFRLVAATSRNLAADVEAGRFRRDLYFQLLVFPIELPPLRDRPGDVPLLFRHFWAARGEARAVDGRVLDALTRHFWPGNVRELENVVERISIAAEGPAIGVDDLPAPLRGAALGGAPAQPVSAAPDPRLLQGGVDLARMLRTLEDGYIDAALARTGGNRKAAADLLGLQRTTLVEKLRRRQRGAHAAA
jgi:sigma-54 specific flagellar transcriptional regulator A